VFEDTASALFGVEGLRVTDAQAGPDGVLEVWAATDYPAAAACPDCGVVSGRVHERVLARPQNDDIPELASLAKTISRWEDQIACAVLTGVTNATSESLNRLAKLEARLAYGFRNPLNQRRRVRIACTRGYRRRSPTATPKRTQPVTRRQPDPG
jgi:hypothetical protein